MEQTIIGWLRQRAAQTPERPALCVKSAGEYHWTTWRDFHSLVLRTALALRDWGIERGDRAAQWSENRLEWIVCDLALQWLAAVHVPLHANRSAEQAAIQIQHSGATRVLVSGGRATGKAAERREPTAARTRLPGIRRVRRPVRRPTGTATDIAGAPQLDPRNEADLTDLAQSRVSSGTLATILYTCRGPCRWSTAS
jgi:long-subunit acyl-CoA synthetase (AMP-forming)